VHRRAFYVRVSTVPGLFVRIRTVGPPEPNLIDPP
jgi:hypothetical protein